jgi:hypothetical protein
MTFAQKVISYFRDIESPPRLPKGIEVMNPYGEREVMKCVTEFFRKFYSDTQKRVYILGINPGRFGAGITGISFTDPVALREECGIPNELGNARELSSKFVYEFIHRYGGVEKFYGNFYLNSICPLGFTRDGRNYNYYDDPRLLKMLEGYIVSNLWKQIGHGAVREHVICLGTGRNFDHFKKLNEKHGFFGKIYPIEHPRFILQYKRKHIPAYVEKYTALLGQLCP